MKKKIENGINILLFEKYNSWRLSRINFTFAKISENSMSKIK